MIKMLKNNVNNLSGKEWLKNSVNYWIFDSEDINKIYRRFELFCYKKGTNNDKIKNVNSIKVKESDFSFNYIKNQNDLKNAMSVIKMGNYNSYHVIYTEKEIFSNKLVENTLYKNIVNDETEYRGKIIIDIKSHQKICYAFLFLNRIKCDKDKNFIFKDQKIIKNKIGNKNFVIESRSKIDKIGLKHPAPYSYIDIEKLCDKYKIKNKIILDPFFGVGSTFLGTYKKNVNIGIELNNEYIKLANERFKLLNFANFDKSDRTIIQGDCLSKVSLLKEKIDIVITSPPYFSILKNNTDGVRTDKSQSRQGIVHYSKDSKDFENFENYELYVDKLGQLFSKIKKIKNNKLKLYIIISDFTVNKKERNVHGDVIQELCNRGFVYTGTDYILQNQKSIYPFGYPYKIVLNHIYQYIIKFEG